VKSAVDSTIIISALCSSDPRHAACRKRMMSASHAAFTHALTETFSTLTGGRLGFRISASDAASLLREQISSKLNIVSLDKVNLLHAYDEAETRGIRGGAIYDYLHLVAARRAGAKIFFTLNLADFQAFHRPGDPVIQLP
jgi:predicted nucleic acid-binding protein